MQSCACSFSSALQRHVYRDYTVARRAPQARAALPQRSGHIAAAQYCAQYCTLLLMQLVMVMQNTLMVRL
jgi:hypothetical protein